MSRVHQSYAKRHSAHSHSASKPSLEAVGLTMPNSSIGGVSSYFYRAVLVLFGLAGLVLGTPENTPDRPNLLFILTDQQRADTLGAYGNKQIKTPHLDALAKKAFLFEAFYVANPMCSPSRATLLTGLYSHTHGVRGNNIPLSPNVPILIDMLERGDYVAGYYGKWHLGNEIFRQRVFDHFESTEIYQKSWSPDQDHSHRSGYDRFLSERGVKSDGPYGHSRDLANRLPKELSKPAYLAKMGVEFIERYRDRPFVLYLSFLEPHAFADHSKPPFDNVNDDLYDPADMEIPATFFEPMDPTVSYPKREARVSLTRGEFPVAYPQTVEEYRQAKARYWGLVTLVDEMVGFVLQRLRELGLEENTIIVFTSEHGEMMGDHRLMSKEFSYEESIRVPMLLKVPGTSGGRRIAKPVSQVDLLPTLLELMDQPLPFHLQGRSLAPHLLEGLEVPDRDVVVISSINGFAQSWNRNHIAQLRTLITPDGWKLTLNDVGGGELYSLREDRNERHNLFLQRDQRKRVQQLAAQIRGWQRATGDDIVLDLNQSWPVSRRTQSPN